MAGLEASQDSRRSIEAGWFSGAFTNSCSLDGGLWRLRRGDAMGLGSAFTY